MSTSPPSSDPLAALADLLDPPKVDPATDPYTRPGDLERALNPKAWTYPHLDLIDEYLVRLEQRTLGTRGLMIFMQPRAGKSQRCSRVFPTWYLRRHPDHRIILGTYGKQLGEKHARWVRNTITSRPELGLRLASDSRRVDDWQLAGSEGGMRTAGVGGAVTGMGGDLIIIDDPVKNREQAESQTYRDKTWDWWTDDLSTRFMSGGVALLMMTRWHEDDLAGRLLKNEPHNWTVLTLPAIADADGDPLGRAEGDVLMPDRYGKEWMAEQQARLGSYGFTALYQQRPSPAEGALFKKGNFKYWRRVEAAEGELWQLADRYVRPKDCWKFATVDLAASEKTSADWTVCSVWAVTPEGDLVLLDRERQRIDEGSHWPLVRRLCEKHAKVAYVGVESRMFGTRLVFEAGRAGLPIRELKADVDKVTRALPAVARTEQGRAWWPAAEQCGWLEEWEHELLSFPNGAHDDQVDTFAYACLELALGRRPGTKDVPVTPDEKFAAHLAAVKKPKKSRRPGHPLLGH